MAGYLSYPSLLGINNPCLSKYVSPGDTTISSLLKKDGSRTYSTFRIALDNHWLSTAMALSVSFHQEVIILPQ